MDDSKQLRESLGRAEVASLAQEAAVCAEFEKVWDLLGRVAAPSPPSEALLAQVAAAVRGEPLHPLQPQQLSLGLVAVLPVVLLASYLLGIPLVKHHPVGWLLSAAMLAGALGAATLALRWPMASLITTLFVGGVGALIGSDPHLAATPIAGCTIWEAAMAVVPLAVTAVLVLRRSAVAARGPWPLAAAAAAGALAGQALMHAACPARDYLHLFAFHASGVIIAALIGLAIGALPALRASYAAASSR